MENDKTIKTIKVAILAEEPLGWGSGKHYFPVILNNYSWNVKKKKYKFVTSFVYDTDILSNKLVTSNFDVLLVPGGGVGDGQCIKKGFKNIPKVRKWKNCIKRFVQEGNGYVGICGGAALLTELETENKRKTLVERLYNNSAITVSSVKSFYNHLAFPIFYPKQKKSPENVGAMSYVFSFKPGEMTDGRRIFSAGVPIDFIIDTSHDFFKGYNEDTLKMRWWGGPGLKLKSNQHETVDILARYPSFDFSKNKETRIRAWCYTGGFLGLIRALRKALLFIKREQMSLKKVLTFTFYFMGDWKKTNKYIQLDMGDQVAMTFEKYPNKYQGRMVLCTAHPEYMIWNGGYIDEDDDTSFNCIGSGFHQWKSIQNFSKSGLKELTNTWWVVRRSVAWAAKVTADDLPPIYDYVQLNDDVKRLVGENFWDGTEKSKMENI